MYIASRERDSREDKSAHTMSSKKSSHAKNTGCDRVLFIAVGGTIDKDYPRLTRGYAFEFGEIPALTRILDKINACFDQRIVVPFQKDSTEMTDEDRSKIVSLVSDSEERFVVVTHGTDTLLDTAKQIGFQQKEAGKGSLFGKKVIVVTGAMRPERFSNSDANFNVGCAVGALWNSVPGTYVAMNGVVRPHDAATRCFSTGKFVGPGEATPP